MSDASPAEEAKPSFASVESPWHWFESMNPCQSPALCNICWWHGPSFVGPPHSEGSACPACGSIARDRFLFFSFLRSMTPGNYRVLETSPRLGMDYREAMARWFSYRASDFDQRAHRTDLQLDLQNLDLDDASLDVILTPHVLEHVPDTDQALAEIFRVLVPGGSMFLQVPIQQGWTAPPANPEFHGDQTAVFWRFGMDLTQRLREHGFQTKVVCNTGFFQQVASGSDFWPDPTDPYVDVRELLTATSAADLVPLADEATSARLSFFPSYMFLTWRGIKPLVA